MAESKLTPLQRRILRALAGLTPPWTLTGGGALAGVHLRHRTTRDLDLFWRGRTDLGDSLRDGQHALRADGLDVVVLRTAPTFGELRVSDSRDVCIVDLVTEPFAPVRGPERADIDGTPVFVDSMHEILVNKLTALLSRSEVRDLVDVRALLEAGTDLAVALRDAPRKDAGFSPLTLAWVLNTLDLQPGARALGWSPEVTGALASFRTRLVEAITAAARPE